MMIDLILFGTIAGAFYVGFKLGNKYTTFSSAWAGIKAKVFS